MTPVKRFPNPASIVNALLSGARKRAFSVRASMDYDQALDELYPSLNEWVFYGSSQAKNDLVAAYEALPPNLRRAWDEGVRRAFVSYHGGTTAKMYRRVKNPSRVSTSGLSVTTDDVSRKAQYVVVFEVNASDVLAHHAQTDTPLASKSLGHEKEVILAPGNRAKLVTVLENW